MILSLDLDDTLITIGRPPWPCEPGLPCYPDGGESLRLGTVALFCELRSQGHAIWLYTNSYRSCEILHTWFSACGIPVDGIINQSRHDDTRFREDPGFKKPKNPTWFGIDLHVDDLDLGAELRGLRVSPSDESWAEKVVHAIHR